MESEPYTLLPFYDTLQFPNVISANGIICLPKFIVDELYVASYNEVSSKYGNIRKNIQLYEEQ